MRLQMKRLFVLLTAIALNFFLIMGSAWANVEGKNLQSFTVRQLDYLIIKAREGYPYAPEIDSIVSKVNANLDSLCEYLHGLLELKDFNRISERLSWAVEDWENAQFSSAANNLGKAKTLLRSFGF